MTPADLSATILAALDLAIESDELVLDRSLRPTSTTVERPKSKDHGDYASNIALQLAKPVGRPPRDIATVLARHLAEQPGIASVDVAGPGFMNITLEAAAQGELARAIVMAGDGYGRTDLLAGERINLEFVSANPTGPMHMGDVRWAAVGDALARVLQAAGADVAREYYFNDHGAQIDRFARSLMARAKGQPAPDDGYVGAVHR